MQSAWRNILFMRRRLASLSYKVAEPSSRVNIFLQLCRSVETLKRGISSASALKPVVFQPGIVKITDRHGAATINYQYASAGVFNQNQFIATIRRPFRGGFALSGRYEYNRAFGNTDGINMFPANQYNLQADYGQAATDLRHSGTRRIDARPIWHNPQPVPCCAVRTFNITTRHDNNGDTVF